MKVCILTHTFPRNEKDTAAAFMKEFADGLVEAGNRVVVVAPYDQAFKRRKEKFKIVLYKYVWLENWHVMGYSRAMKADVSLKLVDFILLPFLLLSGSLALIKTVKKEKIDLINVHWILPNGVMALVASLVTGVPYVITLPGTDAFLAFRNKAFGLVAKIVALRSAGIVSNSSWHLKRILDLGVGDKTTDIISYPTDILAFRPTHVGVDQLRHRLKIPAGHLILLAIGRLVYKKGFSYLIKALPAVVKKHPKVVLVIGGDGDLKQNLKSLARELGMGDKVIFVGNINRDEIARFYNLADVFIAPSVVDQQGNVDGGPVVAFESMACGKPQVVTNVLGVADIIQEGVNGSVVDQKDALALVRGINKLLAARNLREKMGKANRKLIIDTLDTRKIGIRYTRLFKRVLENE